MAELSELPGFGFLKQPLPGETLVVDGCIGCFSRANAACNCSQRCIQRLTAHQVENQAKVLFLATAETPPEVLVKETPARRGGTGMYARAAASSAPVSSVTSVQPPPAREECDKTRLLWDQAASADHGLDPSRVPLTGGNRALLLGQSNSYVVLDTKDERSFTDMFKRHADRPFAEQSTAFVPQSGSLETTLHKMLFTGNNAELKTKARALALTMEIGDSVQDRAIMLASSTFCTTTQDLALQLPPELLFFVVNAAWFVSFDAIDAPAKRNVSALREFAGQIDTCRRRAVVAAKVLKLILFLKLAGYHLVEEAIRSIIQQLEAAEAEGHRLEDKDVNCDVAMAKIAQLFLGHGLHIDSADLSRILCAACFRLKRQWGQRGADDSSDDESDHHAQSDDEDIASEREVVMSSVEQVHQFNKGLLYLIKGAIVCKLVSAIEENKIAMVEYKKRMESLQDGEHARDPLINQYQRTMEQYQEEPPLKLLKRLENGNGGHVYLTQIQAKMEKLINARPSVQNVVEQLSPDERGNRFGLNGQVITGQDFKGVGSTAIQDVVSRLARCLDGEEFEAVRSTLLEMLDNPFTSQVELRFGVGKSNPRLEFKDKALETRLQSLATSRAKEDEGLSSLESAWAGVTGLMWMTSSAVFRPNDLQAFDFGNGTTQQGSFYAYPSAEEEFGTIPPLLYAGTVQKTQLDAISLIHPVAVKAILFYLQHLVPWYAAVIFRKTMDSIDNVATLESLSATDKRLLKRALIETTSRYPSSELRTIAEGLKKWKNAKGELKVVETDAIGSMEVRLYTAREKWTQLPFQKGLFAWRTIDKVRQEALIEVVRDKWMPQVSCATSRQLRALSVNFRVYGADPSRAQGDGQSQTPLEQSIRESEAQLAQDYNSMVSSAPNGMHSRQTLEMNYSSAEVVGTGQRIPRLHLRTSSLALSKLARSLRLPSVSSDARLPNEVTRQGKRAQKENLVVSLREKGMLSEESDLDELTRYLTAQLKERFGKEIKDPEQLETMVKVAMLARGKNIIIALPCGMGKTVSWVLPFSLFDNGGVVLVVCPTRALVESQLRMMASMNLQAHEWDRSRPEDLAASFSGIRGGESNDVNFIYVVTDAVAQPELRQFIEAAVRTQKLLAVVYDEVHHLILSATFRDVMDAGKYTSSLGVPTIALSGTCPSSFHRTLAARMHLNPDSFVKVTTSRDPNASRRVINLIRVDEPEDAALALLEHSSSKKVLVFMLQTTAVESFFDRVSANSALSERSVRIVKAHSQLSHAELEAAVCELEAKDAESAVICISSSILAEGVDISNVDEVVVVGGVYRGLVGLTQMASRTARGPGSDEQEMPQVTVLFSERYVLGNGAGGSSRWRQDESHLLKMFDGADVGKVRSVVSLDGLGKAVDGARTECGRCIIHRVLQESSDGLLSPIEPCGACSSCDPHGWRYSSMNATARTERLTDYDIEQADSSPSGEAAYPDEVHFTADSPFFPSTDPTDTLQTEASAGQSVEEGQPMHEQVQSITQQGDDRVAEPTRQGGGRLTECVEESGTAVAMRARADRAPSLTESDQISAKTDPVRAQSPDQAPSLSELNQSRVTTGALRALPGAGRTQASAVNAPSITAWFKPRADTVSLQAEASAQVLEEPAPPSAKVIAEANPDSTNAPSIDGQVQHRASTVPLGAQAGAIEVEKKARPSKEPAPMHTGRIPATAQTLSIRTQADAPAITGVAQSCTKSIAEPGHRHGASDGGVQTSAKSVVSVRAQPGDKVVVRANPSSEPAPSRSERVQGSAKAIQPRAQPSGSSLVAPVQPTADQVHRANKQITSRTEQRVRASSANVEGESAKRLKQQATSVTKSAPNTLGAARQTMGPGVARQLPTARPGTSRVPSSAGESVAITRLNESLGTKRIRALSQAGECRDAAEEAGVSVKSTDDAWKQPGKSLVHRSDREIAGARSRVAEVPPIVLEPGMLIEMASQQTADCMKYLRSRHKQCLLCRKEYHEWANGTKDGPEPNHCPRFRLLAPANCCRICMQAGHAVKDMTDLVKSKQREDPLLRKCVVLCTNDHGYRTIKPCTHCWLVHTDENPRAGCAVSKHLVRSCFIAIWLEKGWRASFLEEQRALSPNAALGSFQTLREFVDWGVYGETDHLHNVFRVVSFVKGKLGH